MTKSRIDTTLLENRIGYRFKERELLERALTHSSYSNESGLKNHHMLCNERLEFLGDSVLSIITSNYLYRMFSDCPEGELTRMRAEVVCERALSGYSESIGLGEYLLLGIGEEKNNGRQRKSILADAFEALLAAIYLDSGMEQVKAFLLPRLVRMLDTVSKKGIEDYKSMLQRIVQQTPEEKLFYTEKGEEGPPHDRIFHFEVYLNSNLLGTGKGRTKREAEQQAAKHALILLGELNEETP